MKSAADELLRGLLRILPREQIRVGPDASRAYDCDAYTVDRALPAAIAFPESTEEVAKIVRWCNETSTPFTARGAGTGLSGGVLPALGGVVISLKRMTEILEVDLPNRRLRAQAGAVNRRLSDAVREQNLHFAPDPSSQSVSTLGGNIAENSGGPHTLKYGVTVQHVLGLTLVDPRGETLELGGTPGAPGYDFVGLLVGSEGTLGIVTEAWVRLTPLPRAVETALASFPSVRGAAQTVADLVSAGVIPAALEVMDRGILKALSAAFHLEYPPGTDALLLIECDSGAEDAAHAVAAEMTIAESISRANGALDFVRAVDEADRQRLWTARKKGIGAMGRLAPSIVTHDGVIPRSRLPEMLEFVYAVAERHGIYVANLFHAGDGNLHPCFAFDDRDPEQIRRVVEAGEEVVRRCIDLGGSVTGEHGIGVEKVDLMPLMFTPQDLELQARAKSIFNEGMLCNPCKVLPNQRACAEHQSRWRGVAW